MKGWALLSNTLFSAMVCSTFTRMVRMVTVVYPCRILSSTRKQKYVVFKTIALFYLYPHLSPTDDHLLPQDLHRIELLKTHKISEATMQRHPDKVFEVLDLYTGTKDMFEPDFSSPCREQPCQRCPGQEPWKSPNTINWFFETSCSSILQLWSIVTCDIPQWRILMHRTTLRSS